jgi:hypothetical protein
LDIANHIDFWQVTEELEKWLARFNQGHKRIIAAKKQNGDMQQHEGKIGFSMTAYVFLAERFLKDYSQDTAYSHLFFVIMWNLISRSIVVADMKYDFIHQDNDMIVVLPPKNKADQAGEKIEGKHIAANPFNPMICPVLALAIHVFSDGNRVRYNAVFTRDAYDRFGRAFKNTVSSEAAQAVLQVDAEVLGKHSVRKASATYASSFPGGTC